MNEHLRIPGKTVYVIGTGFSRPLGLPVIAEFIPEGLSILKRHAAGPQCPTQICLQEIGELLGKHMPWLRLAQSNHTEPTIDDLFSAVDLFDAEPGAGETERNKLCGFIREVCRLALEEHVKGTGESWLGSKQVKLRKIDQVHLNQEIFKNFENGAEHLFTGESNQICPYIAFLSQIIGTSPKIHAQAGQRTTCDSQSCAIISLNYDSVVEEKIKELNWGSIPASGENGRNNPAFRIYYGDDVATEVGNPGAHPAWVVTNDPQDTDVPLIKLHGSFNWEKAISTPQGNQVWVKNEETAPAAIGANIVWPTWTRSRFEGVSGLLLNEALKHLSLASRVVFIGYSMSLADRHIRYLLAKAFNTPELPEVEICNYTAGSPDAAERELRLVWEQMLGELAKRIKTTIFSDGFVEYVKKWRCPGLNDPAE